jgi:23S rRNA pseudouridine1911/1915/1917 synthase
VLVNERLVAVASRDVSESDRIAIIDERPDIAIIKETADWIAVDKPAGMPTQPTRDRKERSLEELLRARFRSIYLVHRIDSGTSGVVVFARNRETAARLSELFASRAVRKTYLAVVDGTIDREIAIDTPIEGKEALTIVRPQCRAGNPAGSETGRIARPTPNLVEVEIKTGRMHQIRVHLASIGHPVAGDLRYGGSSAPRLMLHAWKLAHDALGELIAPPPPDFG